jgi:methylmalonyl-CoA/ethylmalonyl-CoA epimerase
MVFHHFGLVSTAPELSCEVLTGLGYTVSGPVEDLVQNVRLFWGAHSTMPAVEIISPTATPGAVSNLVQRIQQGVYHLCFEVEDLEGCLEKLGKTGRIMLVSPPKPAVLFEGRKVSFHFVDNFGLIELLQQA